MLSRRRSKRIWRMTIRGMPSGSQQRLRESTRRRATPARRIGAKNGTPRSAPSRCCGVAAGWSPCPHRHRLASRLIRRIGNLFIVVSDRGQLTKLAELVDISGLKVAIDHTFALAEGRSAFKSGRATHRRAGKTVVVVRHSREGSREV
jgi:hypothetical protein